MMLHCSVTEDSRANSRLGVAVQRELCDFLISLTCGIETWYDVSPCILHIDRVLRSVSIDVIVMNSCCKINSF